MTTRTLFCFGLGYTAQRLAARLIPRGFRIAGTVRGEDKAAALGAEGIDARVWGGAGGAAPGLPEDPDAVFLVSVPPDVDGCPAARIFAREVSARSVIYLSTTGVYGDRGGAWVDETSAPSPSGERGARRLAAETDWQRGRGGATAIARLPGIYGPGRSAVDRVRDGTARRIVKPGQVFSRIHVDDLAAGLEALIDRGVPDGVYHFADDEPAPPEAPIAHAAALLGVEPPPVEDFETADLSPMARSFYAECKRVASARTREALGWAPRFPTYREGLAALI